MDRFTQAITNGAGTRLREDQTNSFFSRAMHGCTNAVGNVAPSRRAHGSSSHLTQLPGPEILRGT
jgi:hypothetical protein